MNITKEQLIACIESATQTMKVKTPSEDYYAGPMDMCTETVEFVNPSLLINALHALEGE